MILALAAGGALTSSLLEVIHYRAYAAPAEGSLCAFGERLDCSSVALSTYAVWLGVPLPVWGLAGYCAVGIAAWHGSRWLLSLAGLAALTGLGLTLLSGWGVGAFCVFCELAHLLSLILFVCAWRSRRGLEPALSAGALPSIALPSLGILLGALLFMPPYWRLTGFGRALPFAHGKTPDGDPWLGAEQPRLTLEEFVDYTCPHCKAASARSLRRLAAHPNELRIVRRHAPRMPCQTNAESRCLPLRIALCAAEQDQFWPADRWLFEHSQGSDVPDPALAAHDLALDPERLARCVTSATTLEGAAREWRRAKKRHLPGTPSYVVDEQIVTATAASQLIDAL